MNYQVHLSPEVERLATAIATERESERPDPLGPLGHLSNVLGDALALGLERLSSERPPPLSSPTQEDGPASEGALLERRRERDRVYLCLDGRPLHPDTLVELHLLDGRWIEVRFAWSLADGTRPLFYLPLDGEQQAPIATPITARFRWTEDRPTEPPPSFEP